MRAGAEGFCLVHQLALTDITSVASVQIRADPNYPSQLAEDKGRRVSWPLLCTIGKRHDTDVRRNRLVQRMISMPKFGIRLSPKRV
jgi:hypothetical protein